MPREAPSTNTIYTGMIGVSLAAVLVGCLVLALELTNDYDWVTEVKAAPATPLPTKGGPPGAAAPGGGGMAALGRSPLYLDDPVPTPPPAAKPATVPPPTVTPAPAPLPAPVVVTPEPPKPAEPPAQNENANKPTGIVPSPFKLSGNR